MDLSFQGRGVGTMLLANAVKRTMAISDEIGIYAMVVDAINGPSEEFYLRYGFNKLTTPGNRLYLPLTQYPALPKDGGWWVHEGVTSTNLEYGTRSEVENAEK